MEGGGGGGAGAGGMEGDKEIGRRRRPRVLLGVSGSVAAIKVPQLVSMMMMKMMMKKKQHDDGEEIGHKGLGSTRGRDREGETFSESC